MATPEPLAVRLQDEQALIRLTHVLVAEGFQTGAETVLDRMWFDTFDWRLWRAGMVLEQDQEEASTWLRLRTLGLWGPGMSDIELDFDEQPLFADDLPDGPLEEAIENVIGVRALLSVGSAQITEQTFTARNADDKVVVRVIVELGIGDPAVIVAPVRGYEKVARGALALVQAVAGRDAAADPVVRAALAAGLEPGDRGGPFRPELHADGAARAALSQILAMLVDDLTAHEEGTLEGIDIEFLHDFQQTAHRLRAALVTGQRLGKRELFEHLVAELNWIDDMTKPVRDLDVYIVDFDRWRSLVPASRTCHLAPLLGALLNRRSEAHAELVNALASSRYREFLLVLSGLAADDRVWKSSSSKPTGRFARRVLTKGYNRLLSHGSAVVGDSPDELLHDLRVEVARLAHLLESYASVFPDGPTGKCLRATDELRKHLSRFEELCAQVLVLASLSKELVAAGQVGTDQLFTIGTLIENLDRERMEERRKFARRFSDFNSTKVRKRFQQLGAGS